MSQHRGAPVRPRYGRLAALGTSLAVTVIAVLGGAGALPSAGVASSDHDAPARSAIGTVADTPSEATTPSADPSPSLSTDAAADPADDTALPAGSGTGKRVVFSQSRQRVWLVDAATGVRRTYLVSGSVTDNLHPGTYAVYSKSRWAVGVDDSGVMQYFARFTQGPTGAAIGFHSIPTKDGQPLQTQAQLGTPESHGCIRQKVTDAIALWDFAPVGTTVVVTA